MIISVSEALNCSESSNPSDFEAMPALLKSSSSSVRPRLRRRPTATPCLWAQGLCGGPDAPDASGGPPLEARRLTFRTRGVGAAQSTWDTLLVGRVLYVALPEQILPEGSRDAFVALLEAAEERLQCAHVVVVFGADRPDRQVLVRTFMFLGFAVLAPSSPLVPPGLAAKGNLCMLYNIE